jgi:lambda family phage portal protein
MTGLVDGGLPGGNITTTIAPVKMRADAGSYRIVAPTAYHAAGSSQELSGFHPMLRSSDAETMPSRDKIVARSRDIDRNNGVIAGGIDRRVDAVVGANIWLKCKPDFAAMGQTAEWADQWSIQVESLFRVWANSSRFLCDVERNMHFGGMVRLAYYHYVREGKACAPIYFLDRGGIFSTSVLVLDPDRLSNPVGKPDSENLRGGIELDQYGAAVAYHVRNAHPSDLTGTWDASKWTRIPREDKTGRPLFVHAVDRRRAHQRDAVGRLASVMARIKMQGISDKTEIEAQIQNSIFGMYATSARGSAEMAQSMAPVDDGDALLDDARISFYEQADLTYGGVRVAVLPGTDEIKTIASDRGNENFVPFQNYILRAIASALGVSYEQLSNDWSGINYSSARTLLNEIWRGLIADRHLFTQSFCTPIFSAWLQEAVARDLIEVPGGKAMFYAFRDALTQCDWVGPGRGVIDPLKEANGAAINREGLVSTLEDDCAESGKDWRQVMWQRKREEVARENYGLAAPAPTKGSAAPSAEGSQDNADSRESAGQDA